MREGAVAAVVEKGPGRPDPTPAARAGEARAAGAGHEAEPALLQQGWGGLVFELGVLCTGVYVTAEVIGVEELGEMLAPLSRCVPMFPCPASPEVPQFGAAGPQNVVRGGRGLYDQFGAIEHVRRFCGNVFPDGPVRSDLRERLLEASMTALRLADCCALGKTNVEMATERANRSAPGPDGLPDPLAAPTARCWLPQAEAARDAEQVSDAGWPHAQLSSPLGYSADELLLPPPEEQVRVPPLAPLVGAPGSPPSEEEISPANQWAKVLADTIDPPEVSAAVHARGIVGQTCKEVCLQCHLDMQVNLHKMTCDCFADCLRGTLPAIYAGMFSVQDCWWLPLSDRATGCCDPTNALNDLRRRFLRPDARFTMPAVDLTGLPLPSLHRALWYDIVPPIAAEASLGEDTEPCQEIVGLLDPASTKLHPDLAWRAGYAWTQMPALGRCRCCRPKLCLSCSAWATHHHPRRQGASKVMDWHVLTGSNLLARSQNRGPLGEWVQLSGPERNDPVGRGRCWHSTGRAFTLR
ncbi:unnamed protein product [Prorocentrum cordatum]|uniref:Uncharacterized protein n=1 Tax=Prorocentrum cordatum TaxID=2364126 RepID=A0ABN9WZ18_9DINO|nr:unnamed protein product [Polarella glacialis]